jgi:hypothetical protein
VVFGEPVRFWEEPLADMEHEEAAKYLENRVSDLKHQINN